MRARARQPSGQFGKRVLSGRVSDERQEWPQPASARDTPCNSRNERADRRRRRRRLSGPTTTTTTTTSQHTVGEMRVEGGKHFERLQPRSRVARRHTRDDRRSLRADGDSLCLATTSTRVVIVDERFVAA